MKHQIILALFVLVLSAGLGAAAEGLFCLSMAQDFDEVALEDYAAHEDWQAVWDAAYEEAAQSLDMAGDWLLVSAILETPLIRWVRIMGEADREGYDARAAQLLYQGQITDYPPHRVLEVGVSLFGFEPEHLAKDKVSFVLKDDQGQLWEEPTVTVEGIWEQTYSFGTAYDEYFNVVFDFGDQEPDWTSIEELTLLVVSNEDDESYALSWALEPLP